MGAAALGDIGCIFPDNDPTFKDADSLVLLKEVVALLKKNGYSIVNIDSTLIAQQPKMRPYIDEMRRNIAEACNVDIGMISVKATTEEKLGFTGELLGISAHAVCIIN
jgi:2-C-methyl-D-erythritol 2,4-cyclodiphosphate synthase